ncbi:MAG TPA: hypothetical protein VG275_06940 [Solirubrobacteraceae bacterium]|jgi:hypothetical protein|nr:hypothetical protein [Solirubrobacteraceae bacterium]
MSAARRLARATKEPPVSAIPQPVPPPKQITYPNVIIEVQPQPEGHVVMVIAAPGETLVFPMGVEYAQELGKKLTAPRIIPAANGHAPPPSMPGERPR